MSYIICIPSSNRVETLKSKTMKLLQKHNLDNYFIFVSQDEYPEYKKHFKNVLIGKKGLKNQRIYIEYFISQNTLIIEMDDDIEEIYKYIDSKTLEPIEDLNLFFLNCFSKMLDAGLSLFGIYPTDNPYFMKDNITTDLRLIVGCIFGFKNSRIPEITLDEKEDYERTILYYLRDGGVMRFNNYCVKTNYFRNKGGLGLLKDRIKESEKSCKYLLHKYPSLVKIKNKKSGLPDIRLIK